MSRPPKNGAEDTLESTREGAAGDGPDEAAIPALLLVFSAGAPRMALVPVPPAGVELGRGEGAVTLDDRRLSRRHALVAREGGRWAVTDLGSRNGTWVDGVAVSAKRSFERPRSLRMADTVLLFVDDARAFVGLRPPKDDEPVVGASLAKAWRSLRRIAGASDTVHVTGASGAGKELAARAFHDASPRAKGPFVAVNCAAIPEGVAERLLFGARKGAYSGASADSDGYVQAAHGGTLFLDEVGDLDPAVQAKLLRVLESREVLPLGALKPTPVDLRVVSATHRDLRAEVAAKRFREDLYFRVGRPLVELPPLRERPEEVVWHLERAVKKVDPSLSLHASLVEACLARPWPGNVRELLAEARTAACEAAAEAKAAVEARHLRNDAGRGMSEEEPAPTRSSRPPPSREELEAALKAHEGNISATARALGVHRTQLRRWIERHGIAASSPDAGEE